MRLKPLAAAALALSAVAHLPTASAATQPLLAPLTGGFLEATDSTDWLTFSLGLPTNVLISGFAGYGSWFTSVGLYSYGGGVPGALIAPVAPSISYPGAFSAYYALLGPGDYALKVSGAGDYKFYPALSPIPEPQTLGLMLAGVGTLGWIVHRRRKLGG